MRTYQEDILAGFSDVPTFYNPTVDILFRFDA